MELHHFRKILHVSYLMCCNCSAFPEMQQLKTTLLLKFAQGVEHRSSLAGWYYPQVTHEVVIRLLVEVAVSEVFGVHVLKSTGVHLQEASVPYLEVLCL